MSNPEDPIDLVVVVGDDVDPDALERALREAGLGSIKRLDAIGMILGRAPAAVAGVLRGLPGVRSVDKGHDVSI